MNSSRTMSKIYFPQVQKLSFFIKDYTWGTSDPGKIKRPTGSFFISLNRAAALRKPGSLLYGYPTQEFSEWIKSQLLLQNGSMHLIERNDKTILVVWQATQIIADAWLTIMSPESILQEIPWNK